MTDAEKEANIKAAQENATTAETKVKGTLTEMEVLKMRLDAEKQDHIAKLYALAVAKGEKLDPKTLPYQEDSSNNKPGGSGGGSKSFKMFRGRPGYYGPYGRPWGRPH